MTVVLSGERCCATCQWVDRERELCLWADHNPLPGTIPFWMDRACLTYVDHDDGTDCSAWEPRIDGSMPPLAAAHGDDEAGL